MGIKIYIGQRETGPIESEQQSVMMDAMPNFIEQNFSGFMSQKISKIQKKCDLTDGAYHKKIPL